jgi:transcriptional regulator with XRE-family HTH domain
MLKLIDIYVLVGLLAHRRPHGWTQAEFAASMGIPAPALTRALQRLAAADLWYKHERRVNLAGALDLLVHAVRYLAPPRFGPPTRGLPTAHAAPPLSAELYAESPLVWPDEEGGSHGPSLTPLHPAAPGASRRDPQIHEMLALVDALRVGRARERALAERLLRERACR